MGPPRPGAATDAPPGTAAAMPPGGKLDAPPVRAAPAPAPAPAPVPAARPAPEAAVKPVTPRKKAKKAAKANGGAREAAAAAGPPRETYASTALSGSLTGSLSGRTRGIGLAPSPAERPAETLAEAAAPAPEAPREAAASAPPPAEPVTAPTFAAAAAYHVPTPMTVGEADTVRLWLDKRATADALLARLRERVGGESGVTRGEAVPATPRMRATLSGAAFEIKPLFDEVQTVYENKDTRWEWEVVPKEAGTHELRVHLRMVLPGTEDSLDSRVWPVQVVAKPLTPWQQFKAWLREAQEVDAMIKGIFGIGIAGVIAWLWARLRRRGGPAAAQRAGGR